MKSTNCKTLQLISLHWSFYLTELNKEDNSHSPGACFHILVCMYDINCKFFIFIFTCQQGLIFQQIIFSGESRQFELKVKWETFFVSWKCGTVVSKTLVVLEFPSPSYVEFSSFVENSKDFLGKGKFWGWTWLINFSWMGYVISKFSAVLIIKFNTNSTGLDKSEYQVNIFLITPGNRMLLVFIRSALPRHF